VFFFVVVCSDVLIRFCEKVRLSVKVNFVVMIFGLIYLCTGVSLEQMRRLKGLVVR